MNNYYGWSNNGIFYCDGSGFGITDSLKTVRVGDTDTLLKEHPPGVKETSVRLTTRRKKGVK